MHFPLGPMTVIFETTILENNFVYTCSKFVERFVCADLTQRRNTLLCKEHLLTSSGCPFSCDLTPQRNYFRLSIFQELKYSCLETFYQYLVSSVTQILCMNKKARFFFMLFLFLLKIGPRMMDGCIERRENDCVSDYLSPGLQL